MLVLYVIYSHTKYLVYVSTENKGGMNGELVRVENKHT